MKKLIFALIATLLMACGVSKRSTDMGVSIKRPTLAKFNGDTLQFINAILRNKMKYQGKPLKLLLKDIKLPVKDFYGYSSMPKNVELSGGMTVLFYTDNERRSKLKKKEDPATLVIEWQKPISYKATDSVLVKNKFKWTSEVSEYFGKQIVGNFVKVQYKELK